MFIREFKTTNKKTGTIYINHKLVESYKVDGKPRQRVVMSLGTLSIPQGLWKRLAYLLETKIAGQTSFTSELEPELDKLAEQLTTQGKFSSAKKKDAINIFQEKDIQKVDLNSVNATDFRSLGPEIVANHIWDSLGFNTILENTGFTRKDRSVAKSIVIGKLISPASELSTWNWFKTQTALSEMTPVDISELGKDSFYTIADKLLAKKDDIEKQLRICENTLFSLDSRLFLYDLTNTYLEGSALKNDIADYGKSKEKRSDCPLVTLALMVDSQGFPVFSQIYSGNQSEPITLSDVLDHLKKDCSNHTNMLPALVMDRGIATKENLALLKEGGYKYIVIERRPVEKRYEEEYTNLKMLMQMKDSPEWLSKNDWTVINADESIYVQKVDHKEVSRVLGYSLSREKKEQAIDARRETRFLQDFENLKRSITKGNLMVPSKTGERIGRLKAKYSGISHCYDIEVVLTDDEKKVTDVKLIKKPIREQKSVFTGCYVIETNLKELTAEQIWHNYMTLSKAESAFRDLKSELGMRPIFHQKSERTKAHLFIGVLAYHMLVCAEATLRANGDTREWKTIKKVLQTHQRLTTLLTTENGQIYHIRHSGLAEPEQSKIYRMFNATDPLRRKKIIANNRS